MRIATDIHGLERVAPPGTQIRYISNQQHPHRWGRILTLFLAALRSDHLVIHFSLPEVMGLATLLTVWPFHRCRFTTLDFFIGNPKPQLRPFIGWCLRRVDRLLVYFRNSQPFEDMLGLPKSKFFYIPFKINAIELIQKATVEDRGYIFTGGRSRRDFATLFTAVEGLPCPVKVITSEEAEMNPHGSTMRGLTVPANVEILRHDSSPEFFVNSMAGARLVALPIVKDSTTQAGIGVYLQALALRKCLIISAGLGVDDVLNGQALIVPPGEPALLREAIKRTWTDPSLRERYAEAGYRYAQPLGGEDELRRSVLNALVPNAQLR